MSCSSFSENVLLLLFGLQYHKDLKLDLKLGQLRPEGIEELITGLCLLSQNQLHYLVISKCEVTIEGAKGLTGALQNYHNLAGLKLYDNTIDPVGKAIVTHALPSLRILTELKLSGQQMNDDEAVSLAAAIRCLSFLHTLDLSHNLLGPDGAAAIGTILPNLTLLGSLDVSHNCFGPAGAIKFAAQLGSISLSRLSVEGTGNKQTSQVKENLPNKDSKAIGKVDEAAGILNYKHLKIVRLSHNNIGDDGAVAICVELRHLSSYC